MEQKKSSSHHGGKRENAGSGGKRDGAGRPKKVEDKRTRNYAFFVYPSKEYLESINSEYDGSDGYGTAPDNWLELLESLHIPYCISPLHDKDKKEDESRNEDGSRKTKKPHWHVIFKFATVKNTEQIKEIIAPFNSPSPQAVNNLMSYTRYLTHMDNPDKHQYDSKDVVFGSGFDYYELISTSSDKYKLVGEMLNFIEIHNLYSYRQLLIYAQNNNEQWFRTLCDNGSYVIKEYLKSRAWEDGVQGGSEICRTRPLTIDKTTGEVIE